MYAGASHDSELSRRMRSDLELDFGLIGPECGTREYEVPPRLMGLGGFKARPAAAAQ